MKNATTFACVITPFADDGSVDESAMTALLSRIGEARVGVYLGSSSPGEGYQLSLDEVERLYALGHDVLKGVVPIRAMGVEPRSAEHILQYVRMAEKCGLDAMQLYCLDLGHGNSPSERELEAYFRNVLGKMEIPALLSSHSSGGYAIPPSMIAALLEDFPHLIGINCTNPSLKYVAHVAEVTRGRAELHVGGPTQALSVLAMGGHGYLSSEANLAPGLCQTVIDGYLAGDMQLMMDAFDQVMRLHSANQATHGSARWMKAAMKALGQPGWNFRPPLLPLTDVETAQVARELEALHLPEVEALRTNIAVGVTNS